MMKRQVSRKEKTIIVSFFLFIFLVFVSVSGFSQSIPEINEPELSLPTLSFTGAYEAQGFPGIAVRDELLEEELRILLPYDTPEKILNLTEEISGSSTLNNYTEDGIPLIFSPDFRCRPFKVIFNERNATVEEVIVTQTIALKVAGYQTSLVTVPAQTEKGIRPITFVAYKKAEEQNWQIMDNPALRELSDKEKNEFTIHTPRAKDLARVFSNDYPAYEINPEFFYLISDFLGTTVSAGYKLKQDDNFKNNLVDNLLTAARKLHIQIAGIHNLRTLGLEQIESLAFSFQMIPEEVLRTVNRIRFLEAYLLKSVDLMGTRISAGKAVYVDFLFLTISQIDLSRGARGHTLVHEIGHIYQDFIGSIVLHKIGFKEDINFLEKFYDSDIKSRKILWCIFHETFAEMFARYVLSPVLLREYIIEEIKQGNFLMANNYLCLKEHVFLNAEYGDTSISSIWRENVEGREYICYREDGKDYCVQIVLQG
ncbi:MAG: hypothetical protein AB7E08_05615 [Candidatus Omnitrophota bacterium]